MTLVPWEDYAGILMDLDGVITPTATVHRSAWGRLFADYDFSDQDYLDLVDGRPRLDGVRAFLASRGITMDTGSCEDPAGAPTLWGQGRLKDDLFLELLDREGLETYPGTIAVLDHCARHAIPVVVVSSSRNARHVLDTAGIAERFDFVVDGITTETEHLAGKPAPDQFLHAAARLGEPPSRLIVVEDAVAGIEAARAGNFGFVLGVDRVDQRAALLAAGADCVVSDLSDTLDSRPRDAKDDSP